MKRERINEVYKIMTVGQALQHLKGQRSLHGGGQGILLDMFAV